MAASSSPYDTALQAVKDFVEALWEGYKAKNSTAPFCLYHRMLVKMKPGDPGYSESLNKVLGGFREFLSAHQDVVLHGSLKTIPADQTILYGTNKKIFIPIGQLLRQTEDDDDVEVAKQHLLIIYGLVDTSKEVRKAVEASIVSAAEIASAEETIVSPGAASSGPVKEDLFLQDVLGQAKSAMEGADPENPAQAVMALLSSGVLQNMMGGLQAGVGSGEMDLNKLMQSMQRTLGGLATAPSGGAEGEKK